MHRAFWNRAGILLITGIFLGPAAPVSEPTYSIRYERAFSAGQNFTIKITDVLHDVQKTELPDGQMALSDTTRTIIFQGDLHVDAVDEKGGIAEASVVVRSFTGETNSSGRVIVLPEHEVRPSPALLAAGSELRLRFRPGQVLVDLGGEDKISDDASAALHDIFPPPADEKSGNDVVYALSDRRKIGDSWPVNVQALAPGKDAPRGLDPDRTDGTVKFKSIRTVAGKPCAQVEATLSSRDVPVQGIEAKESTLALVFDADIPTDSSEALLSTHLNAKIHVVSEQKPGGMASVRRTLDLETTHDVSWLPK